MQIAQGFNKTKPHSRTVALAVNFSKAFDTVNHERLPGKTNHTHLNHNLIHWVSAYLRGRLARCSFGHTLSPFRHLHRVLQGSVISPHLLNFFVSSFQVRWNALLGRGRGPRHLCFKDTQCPSCSLSTYIRRDSTRVPHLLWDSFDLTALSKSLR